MSLRGNGFFTLLNAATVVAVTSSTDATPIVVTATSHGFVTGDRVTINGHATNVAANGTYLVTRLSANTFSLQNPTTGANIAGSGAGAGSGGVVVLAPKIILVNDYKHCVLSIDTGATTTATVKLVGSIADASPDFGKVQSASNQFDFVEMVDLQSGSSVAGDTGISVSGSSDNRQLEANINALRWLSILVTAGSAGTLTVRMRVFDNE